jgi:hypothetical protein
VKGDHERDDDCTQPVDICEALLLLLGWRAGCACDCTVVRLRHDIQGHCRGSRKKRV